MKKALCVLAVLSSTSLPVLAAGVDVVVTGTIEPTACTLSLPGSATVDYDVIDPSTLNGTDYSVLLAKKIDIALSCDAPAKMGLTAVNGRPSTLAGAAEGASTAGVMPATIFGSKTLAGVGLGLDGVDKIGGYGIRMNASDMSVDGKPVDIIAKAASASTWTKLVSADMYLTTEKRHISWASTGTLTPAAFENMTAKLEVQAYINKKSELDLSKSIKLDGMTTIELVYL